MAAGRGMRPFMKLLPVLLACASLAAAVDSEVWTFDRLDRVGGHPTTVVGEPRVVDTPVGKAIEFDGVDDALFVGVHPLAGAQTFTWEAIFRPDGGQPEQRWFHLQESGTENRLLFEIRVIDGRWCLDSYGHSGDAQQADLALLDRIGNTNASSRDGARVSDPIRQRASLRDARRTALRVTPLLRVSVFGRYL